MLNLIIEPLKLSSFLKEYMILESWRREVLFNQLVGQKLRFKIEVKVNYLLIFKKKKKIRTQTAEKTLLYIFVRNSFS